MEMFGPQEGPCNRGVEGGLFSVLVTKYYSSDQISNSKMAGM